MEAFEETDEMLRLLVEHAAIGKINLPERYGISALVTPHGEAQALVFSTMEPQIPANWKYGDEADTSSDGPPEFPLSEN